MPEVGDIVRVTTDTEDYYHNTVGVIVHAYPGNYGPSEFRLAAAVPRETTAGTIIFCEYELTVLTCELALARAKEKLTERGIVWP